MTKEPRGPWARLYAGLIHDPKWLAGDSDARLVFLTGIALAKGAGNTGDLSLRAMVGVQWGAMEPAEVQAAAARLVELELWRSTDDPDRFVIARYDKWQDTAAELEHQRRQKRIGALKTNHGKGQHRTPVDDCPLCHPQPKAPRPSSGGAREETPGQEGGAIAGAKRALRPDQTRPDSDQTPPTPPGPSVDEIDPAEAYAIEVADELIGIVSSTTAEAPQQLVWFTGRALTQGWGHEDLLDVAWDVYGREVDDPIKYLTAALRRRAAKAGPNPRPEAPTDRIPTEEELLAEFYSQYPTEAPTPSPTRTP